MITITKMYEISGLTNGSTIAKNLINITVKTIKEKVANAYLNNCTFPLKLDSGNTIYLDKINPIGKLIQKENT